MENTGDWLYIVILAIAGISSIFSSLRKKKENAAPRQNPFPDDYPEEEKEPEAKGFWDILQEMQEQANKTEKAQKPAPVKAKVEKPKQQYTTIFQQEGQRSITQPIQSSDFADETERHSLIPQDLLTNPDELRKAVIYAEILNRKY